MTSTADAGGTNMLCNSTADAGGKNMLCTISWCWPIDPLHVYVCDTTWWYIFVQISVQLIISATARPLELSQPALKAFTISLFMLNLIMTQKENFILTRTEWLNVLRGVRVELIPSRRPRPARQSYNYNPGMKWTSRRVSPTRLKMQREMDSQASRFSVTIASVTQSQKRGLLRKFNIP